MKAIIRDAVWNRCLPLAQVFCLKQNKWRDFSYSFSHTCIPISFDMVMEFLLSEDVESAVLVLTNMVKK